jgi:hypothetical protein
MQYLYFDIVHHLPFANEILYEFFSLVTISMEHTFPLVEGESPVGHSGFEVTHDDIHFYYISWEEQNKIMPACRRGPWAFWNILYNTLLKKSYNN